MRARSLRCDAPLRFLTSFLSGLVLLTAPAAEAAPFAYISNYGTSGSGNTVSVIDTATNAVTATVTVGNRPYGVAVTPDGARVYVANEFSDTVSVISTATNAVIATVVVGSHPYGVAVTPDGARVYVANFFGASVSVINTATNTVTATVAVGGGSNPSGVAVTPDGARVYVANAHAQSNTVSVISTATNTVVATVAVSPSITGGMAVTPDGSRVYVADTTNNTVLVISTATNTVVATVAVGGAFTPFGVAVTPDGTRVYVTNFNSANVSVISTATNTVTTTIAVGAAPAGVAVTPDGARVYVTNSNNADVSVISTATNTVTATVPVGVGPRGFGQFITPATACSAPPSGMVAWWPMDETAGATSLQDIIGGNNATPSASPVGAAQGPQPVSGEVGGAMHFPKFGNGFSGSRVSPQGTLATIGAADFTIDAWVQVPPAPANRPHYVVNKFDPAQNRGYALYVVSPGAAGSERLEFKWGDGTNVSTVQTISSLTTGQWHHVAVTFARNVGGFALDIRLYVDGAQQGQQTGNPPGLGSIVNFVFLEIGWQPGTIDEPITIDELEIFNRALLQSEIQSIVNAGGTGKCKTMPVPIGPTSIVGGGVACFPLQQPPGSPTVVSYNPSLARPLGETISGNNYSWLFELGAFAGPVDIYLLLQQPNNLPVLFFQYPPLVVSPAVVPFMPPTLGPVVASPLFTVPYSAIPLGTYFGHVLVVPAGTNPATFSFANSPYYYWCFQRTF